MAPPMVPRLRTWASPISPRRSRTVLGSFLARLPDQSPQALRVCRHVDVPDPQRCQRVADCVDDRRRGRDGSGFTDALDSELVGRARRDRVVCDELWDLVDSGNQIVGEAARPQLTGFLVIDG